MPEQTPTNLSARSGEGLSPPSLQSPVPQSLQECPSSFGNPFERVRLTIVVDPSDQPIKVGPEQSFWFSGILVGA